MEAINSEIELNQQSETEMQTQNKTNEQEKIKVSLDNIKIPSASDAFKARVTCQRRS